MYASPLVNVVKDQGQNKWLGRIVFPITYLYYTWIDALARIVWVLSCRRPLHWEFFLPLVELGLLLIANCWGLRRKAVWIGFARAIVLFTILHTVNSIMALWTAYPLHYSDFSLTEGSAYLKDNRDYGLYVLRSTQNHALNSSLPVLVFIHQLCNNHVLYHLFPAVDESR